MDPNFFLGLVAAPFIGSFVNVVALRYPDWDAALWGRSQCPACGVNLGVVDLLPFIGFARRRGRCGACGAAISWRYPLMELAALAIAVWAASATSGIVFWASCVLGWTLLALTMIDARHKLLPDVLTLPLLAAGLAFGLAIDSGESLDRAIGAIAGYASFAAIGWAYWRWRSIEGLGLGDAKLFAAAGAWLGWAGLPMVLLIAAPAALAVTLARRMAGRGTLALTQEIPFGPYLALGFWLAWLYGAGLNAYN
jgi:leader peptidase (prepilin peptidase) / N-methyltransferase